MHLDDAGLVLSPTDLTKHLACAHLTTLDLEAAHGRLTPPAQVDEALQLIFALGLDHERSYLDRLRRAGADVVEIPEDAPLPTRVRLTDGALRAGAQIVYQATFLHAGDRGHADFLVRASRASRLGPFSYDVVDTKLARHLKVAALLQMADYGRHLARVQGDPPLWLTVVTGDHEEHRFRYAEAAAFARRATAALRSAVERPPATVPQPVPHCAQCRWSPRCEAQWRAADHLSLVAFMRSDHRHALEEAGVRTVAQLAAADPATLPQTIGAASRTRVQAQAALQVAERRSGQPTYELLEPAEGLGLLRLPEPSHGDVYLDFEGDPYAEGGQGREYLAGLWDRKGRFTALWAHSATEEGQLTADLLADLCARLDADPAMHVYHYAPYERSALGRLTLRHGSGEQELDRLLRGETLVDLYGVVRQGMRISKGSYSLKKLEAFYWGGVRGSGDQPDDVADALASVVAYERWLVERDPAILASIAAYNADDVRSTHDLHAWLEQRRAELTAVHGDQPRPSVPSGAPSEAVTEAQAREAEVVDRLDAAGLHLLGGLLGWHRRESKPQWWDFYRLGDLTDSELVADSAALGGLGPPASRGALPPPSRSTVWRYPFPPQDTKLTGQPVDVDTHKGVGRLVAVDAAEGWVDLSVASTRDAPTPRALGPSSPVDVNQLQSSLQRTALAVLAGRTPLGQRLLDRVVPREMAALPGERPEDVAIRVGRSLRDAVLAVQGPPGSGKTTVGSLLVRALLDDGMTVGVTAASHAVVGNLLAAVGRPALQKCAEPEHCGDPRVARTESNEDVAAALAGGTHRLVGGTAWLWCRPELADSVDVLVIDEAGQLSLANAVAVSQAARGLVLLGDPQQLTQPSQAPHPHGAGVSALEHLLDGEATLTGEHGVFLDRTWRMHPRLAGVVSQLMYEGRLEAAPGCANQELHAPGALGGAGVRWLPVAHTGNESASVEEAGVVAALVAELLRSSWTDASGSRLAMRPEDILVVAPYNAHVSRLRQALPPSVRVGTVDRFQGQEAPVVVYSMASSSSADAPRGVTFLYDLHRLNVALSRARCVTFVVASPALLDAAVGTPDQLRAVNGFLSVVESADEVSAGSLG